MTVLETTGVAIGILTGLIGISSGIWAAIRTKGMQTAFAVMRAANEGLEAAYRQIEQRQMDERLKCAEDLSELRGRVSVLTGQFAREIARSIVEAMKEKDT